MGLTLAVAPNEVLPFARVVDTGQTECSSNSTPISCGDGTYPGQDADFTGIPKPRTIKAAELLSDGSFVTEDPGTGLWWTSCALDQLGASDSTPTCIAIPGQFDRETARSYCSMLDSVNGTGFAGKTGWRLPSIRELRTLLSYSSAPPLYESASFPGTSGSFWADSAVSGYDPYINFDDGSIYNMTSSAKARCVTGEPIQPESFVSLESGMEQDTVTGLVFTKCAAGQMDDENCSGSASSLYWDAALQYCNGLAKDGRQWRLPGLHELETLLRLGQSPALDAVHFPNSSAVYWTSTTRYDSYALYATAWTINFDSGGMYSYSDKTYTMAAVRCVSGP